MKTEYRNPGSPVGRLQRRHDVPRRRAGEARRAPGYRPRKGGHPVRPGHLDLRLVELDLAVDQLASASTTTSRRSRSCFSGCKHQFERKWNNSTGNAETKAFVPLPPGQRRLQFAGERRDRAADDRRVAARGTAACGDRSTTSTSGRRRIRRCSPRTSSSVPANRPPTTAYYALPALQPGTTYYWKIVSKTMAFVTERRTGLELHNRGHRVVAAARCRPPGPTPTSERSVPPAAPATPRRHSLSWEPAPTSGARPTPSTTSINRCAATAPSSRASRRFRTSPRGPRRAS